MQNWHFFQGDMKRTDKSTEQQQQILSYIFLAFSSRLTPFHHYQKTSKKITLQNIRFFSQDILNTHDYSRQLSQFVKMSLEKVTSKELGRHWLTLLNLCLIVDIKHNLNIVF